MLTLLENFNVVKFSNKSSHNDLVYEALVIDSPSLMDFLKVNGKNISRYVDIVRWTDHQGNKWSRKEKGTTLKYFCGGEDAKITALTQINTKCLRYVLASCEVTSDVLEILALPNIDYSSVASFLYDRPDVKTFLDPIQLFKIFLSKTYTILALPWWISQRNPVGGLRLPINIKSQHSIHDYDYKPEHVMNTFYEEPLKIQNDVRGMYETRFADCFTFEEKYHFDKWVAAAYTKATKGESLENWSATYGNTKFSILALSKANFYFVTILHKM
ncbi:Hypothetical protein POVR1_LOCUS295 [uncultured virus]|nr:Hypothetical protein POVR1_LOCUS295 [uncultured virus]